MSLPPDRDKKGTTGRKLDDDDPLLGLLTTLRQFPNSHLREELLGGLIRSEVEQLSSSGARKDFERLCAEGCHPAVLVAIVSLFRYRAHIDAFWATVVGAPEQREDVCGALDDAAAAIERAFAITLNDETAEASLARLGRIPPARLASELRLYGRTLRLAKLVADDVGVRSLEHISMLILASYVEKATGANHHGPIAGIIAEVCSKPDYSEDAQKQWRYRSREVLDKRPSAVSRISDFLSDVTVALNEVR